MKSETGEAGNALHHNRIPRLLKRHHVRARRPDYRGDLLGAADAAFANVVGEQPHAYSGVFFNNTRYGWSIVTSRRY